MAKYSIEDTTLTNIADAIRTKTGDSSSIMVQDMASKISEIKVGSEPTLQNKTVTPTTSSQTVAADSGYDGLSQVTVNAIPNTYVKPTATKTATTYTPTTSNQTIAAGTYCSGAQTIKGDSNLKAENIKSGVSIFGVSGTHSGSGGASVDTCTVTIDMSDASTGSTGSQNVYIDNFAFMTYENNAYGMYANIEYSSYGKTLTVENVVCDSVFYFSYTESINQTSHQWTASNGVVLQSTNNAERSVIAIAPSAKDSMGSVIVVRPDSGDAGTPEA